MEKLEKQILTVSYWLGVLCLTLAVFSRFFIAFGIAPPRLGVPGGVFISYLAYFHGAGLFFLLAIATWCKISVKS